jgi:hypothetical protein
MRNIYRLRSMDHAENERMALLGLGAALAIPFLFLIIYQQWRTAIMLMSLILMLLAWKINRTLAVCLCFAYLLLLGDLRRIVDMSSGKAGLDPLLLVGALFALYLSLPILSHVRVKDSLSKVMLVMLCVMVLEIFNPKQGSIFIGLSAGLFWIVPVMWFWIGRRYATEEMVSRLLFGVVVPLGVLAAFLGLYQNFVGFLPWEKAWIDAAVANGFSSLFLAHGLIRSFGFSVNSVEFVELMMITILIVGPLLGSRKAGYTLFLPVLGLSIFLASSRTTIIKIIFGYALMWAVRGYAQKRAKVLPRLIFALVVGLGILVYSVGHLAADERALNSKSSKTDIAASHVIQGLANPLDTKKSTAGAHSDMFFLSILSGIEYPVGYGLGSTTLGAGKFSGGEQVAIGSSEIDISDAFLCTGVSGGVCFLLMIFYTFRYLLEYQMYGQELLKIFLIGIFAAMLGSWIGQGRYALAPLMCFLIGFLAKQHIEHVDAQRQSMETTSETRQSREPQFA